MEEKALWKFVKNNTKPSFTAHMGDDGKMYNTVGNKGLREGEIAFKDGGEYNGVAIKSLEEIKPILTNLRVAKSIKKLSNNDIQGCVATLRIVDEVREYGLGIMYEVLKIWLEKNEIVVPNEYLSKATKITSDKLLNWITLYRYAPIQGKFEIVDIGSGKEGTIVPESWLGKEFSNGAELHKKMDQLDWRRGKPPVNFCCIYSMTIRKTKQWSSITQDIMTLNAKIGVIVLPKNSQIIFFQNKKEYLKWLKNIPPEYKIIHTNIQTDKPGQKVVIGCNLDQIINKTPNYNKKETVGILTSRLQKLIRRGRNCAQILKETMTFLWKSPNYNLPEQQFLKVSGCRQLVWRLFISTIEDVEPYIENQNYLSLTDLVCLSLICHIDPDIQFNETIFNQILYTGLLVQHHDNLGSNWDIMHINGNNLEKDITTIKPKNNLLAGLKLALLSIPMRGEDYIMLIRSFNHLNRNDFTPKKLLVESVDQLLSYSIQKDSYEGKLASYDMICSPNILLQLQSGLSFIPYDINKHSTKSLSKFIWHYSSSLNIRKTNTTKQLDPELQSILDTLHNIQKYMENSNYYHLDISDLIKKTKNMSIRDTYIKNNQKIDHNVSRLGFLLLFGQKIPFSYHGKKFDIIIAGTKDYPCKIKKVSKDSSDFLEGLDRFNVELEFIKFFEKNIIIIDEPNPPIGYNWIWKNKKKLQLKGKLIKSNSQKSINQISFYVDDYEIEPFNTTKILVPLPKIKPLPLPKELSTILQQGFYDSKKYNYDHYEINLVMKLINENILPPFDWIKLALESKIPEIVWRLVLLKLYNNYENEVLIGPVDSGGHKLRDSINYLYEGTILRIYNILSALYPNTIIPKTSHKFVINITTPEYTDLIEKLNRLAFRSHIKISKNPKKIIIKTPLWDHQKKTVDVIFGDIIHNQKLGHADASNVGAGKTLTALALMTNLYNYNIQNELLTHGGFLVLLPTTYLYDTWIDEIKKHIQGFEIVTQSANGTLSGIIGINSILITTLGRMRDHPITHPWIFVVIDECLSVQNKSALQTEEAFRQIISSQYRCILLSATFFRARFDKLFYMLKMLDSGLPINKNYLDTILSEHIISNQPTKTREWTQNINKFKLPPKLMKEYNLLKKEGFTSEILYAKLQSFLNDQFDYVGAFRQTVIKAEKRGNRCLIYGKSKEEANLFAQEIKNVTRFPNISGQHIAISWTEGTYGLNNLIFLDCIISHIPQSDKIPQMKGRLDRPGQTSNKLYIEYILVENTIEEAQLFVLEMANRFHKDYILPLSEFYDIAVGKKIVKF